MYITEVSIRRPVIAWVMSLILVVFGIFVFFDSRKLGIALSVSTKTMSAIPSFGFWIQGLVLGFLKTVGLAVGWYKDLGIRNTSQKFVC